MSSKEVAASVWHSFTLTKAEMLSLAIQKAVKWKLLNVELAVLATLAALLLIYVYLFLADITLHLKNAADAFWGI